MGSVKTLIEIIGELKTLDENSTIYAAQPWNKNSRAIIALEPESGELPENARKLGLNYFLEVSIAKDFLEEWMKNLNVKPTLEQQCERLIEYARNDA